MKKKPRLKNWRVLTKEPVNLSAQREPAACGGQAVLPLRVYIVFAATFFRISSRYQVRDEHRPIGLLLEWPGVLRLHRALHLNLTHAVKSTSALASQKLHRLK
jgi:hypothetical protein